MSKKRKTNRRKNIQNTMGKKKNITRILLRQARTKISVTFCLVGVVFLLLAARIFLINYHQGDKYSKAVLDHQKYNSTILPYKRGQIIDRNGTILSFSEKVYNLIIDPKIILVEEDYKAPTLKALVECFGLNMNDLEKILKEKPESHYEKLLKSLTGDEIAVFQKLVADTKNNPDIKGVWFEDSYIRKYPSASLACDVIGFATAANGGEIGLEKYYNDVLSGNDGVAYGYVDENLDIEQTTKAAVDGYNLITTIDYSVQSIIEKHIKAFNDVNDSANTAVVVMDPNNGEILGMASYPVFDLNNPRDLSGLYTAEQLGKMSDEEMKNSLYSLWNNYSVSSIFEPGSTYKSFTISAALEENSVKETDTFICNGIHNVNGVNIKCWRYPSSHGIETLEQTLMNSCNPGLIQISAKLGVTNFLSYQSRFGFGQKTGIDLPSEETGIVKTSDMSAIDLASNSFGQNFNVNMIQIIAGYSSLINGGNYYLPHIVKRIEKNSGEVVSTIAPTLVRQTITKETSEIIKRYLKSTVETGTASKAKVLGYSIAGKTGTAEKYPRNNGKYVISFAGYAPAENPQFLIYVVIDEPSIEIGSSAPVVRLSNDILKDLLPYMGVFKDTDDVLGDTTNSPIEAYSSSPLN